MDTHTHECDAFTLKSTCTEFSSLLKFLIGGEIITGGALGTIIKT